MGETFIPSIPGVGVKDVMNQSVKASQRHKAPLSQTVDSSPSTSCSLNYWIIYLSITFMVEFCFLDMNTSPCWDAMCSINIHCSWLISLQDTSYLQLHFHRASPDSPRSRAKCTELTSHVVFGKFIYYWIPCLCCSPTVLGIILVHTGSTANWPCE